MLLFIISNSYFRITTGRLITSVYFENTLAKKTCPFTGRCMKCPLIYLLFLAMVSPDTRIITETSMDEPNFTKQRTEIFKDLLRNYHIYKINVMLD